MWIVAYEHVVQNKHRVVVDVFVQFCQLLAGISPAAYFNHDQRICSGRGEASRQIDYIRLVDASQLEPHFGESQRHWEYFFLVKPTVPVLIAVR